MKRIFENKVVLITGASSGLGKSLACQFAKNGANVVLLARRFELVSAIAEDLSLKFNKCLAIKCDITDDKNLEEAIQETLKCFKKINIIIANAGFGIRGNLEDLTINDYKKIFETNVFGVLKTIYACLPELKKTKGQICLIGSTNGFVPYPAGSSAYIMTKFALRGLVTPLEIELSPYSVLITHIIPGFIKTEFKKPENFIKKFGWLEMDSNKVAFLIMKAVKNRKRSLIISNHAKLAIFFAKYFPFLLRKINKKIKI